MTVTSDEVALGPERRGRRAALDFAGRSRDTAHLRRRSPTRSRRSRCARSGGRRDRLSDPPRQGRRPRHLARRRPAAPALGSRPSPGPPAHRRACRTRRSTASCRARSCVAWKPSCRSPASAAVRSSRSTRSPRARRLDETLALVRKHAASGALMCTHGDVDADAARPLRGGGRRHPCRPPVAEGLHVDARHRQHRRGRPGALHRRARRLNRRGPTVRDSTAGHVDCPVHRFERNSPCPSRPAKRPPISR